MFNIDPDIVQRVKVAGLFILELYRVTTGTMLSLFIPQSCSNEVESNELEGNELEGNEVNGSDNHVCSLQENFNNADGYHKTVLYWNMFSLFTFFSYYAVELRREEWAIKYLDIDNDKPDNSLKEIIVKEPILDKKMDKLNLLYYRSLLFNCGVYTVNLGLTGKLVKDGYHSSSTLSCFASFSLLVLMKLYSSLEVARQSVKDDKMTSAFMKEFVSYNVLDSDYLEAKEKKESKENEKQSLKDPEKGPTIILDPVTLTDKPPQSILKPELIPKKLDLGEIECIIDEDPEPTNV